MKTSGNCLKDQRGKTCLNNRPVILSVRHHHDRHCHFSGKAEKSLVTCPRVYSMEEVGAELTPPGLLTLNLSTVSHD